ncbi:MAG: hypothetical protein ACR2KZ_18610 [Segetibacter sp.]
MIQRLLYYSAMATALHCILALHLYKSQAGKVLIPGDPEREMETIRIKEGIPLFDSILA